MSVKFQSKYLKFSRHQNQIQRAFNSSMNYCLTISFVSHVKETTAMCVNAIGIRLAYKLHAVRYNKLQLVPKRKMKRKGHLNPHIEYLHVFYRGTDN